MRENITKRVQANPTRYPREIDAALLEDCFYILLHDKVFKKYFKDPLSHFSPIGVEMARVFFERIANIRNYLAHANPISIRQAEQVICYCNDVIDSLKSYYTESGEEQLYNTPSIIQITDSLGNIAYAAEINQGRNSTGGALVDQRNKDRGDLRPLETLTIEVEVDPSFPPDDYEINWVVTGNDSHQHTGKKLVLNIEKKHVRVDMAIYCILASKKDWHRLGDCDDRLTIIYRVLPPV
ncbi:hypothetical protein [Paenibacillus koleovorans]|uniref:hypothetical protein n=1 Tax=Paenibacillus koleovorans TaxID=121608 RepID=UPI000FDAB775|nr:hypothetical protein [Paenibacillus koleovorans]